VNSDFTSTQWFVIVRYLCCLDYVNNVLSRLVCVDIRRSKVSIR